MTPLLCTFTLALMALLSNASAFSTSISRHAAKAPTSRLPSLINNRPVQHFARRRGGENSLGRLMASSEGQEGDDGDDGGAKISLEEKMKSWEATEEEVKAASLGGMTPGKAGTDSFDVGLWIMFPFIVATSVLFFVFPFIKDSIDVSSVGPPPMV